MSIKVILHSFALALTAILTFQIFYHDNLGNLGFTNEKRGTCTNGLHMFESVAVIPF